MRKAYSVLARAGLVLAAGLAVTACAGDVENIDLVQPGYVKKADLLGKTWYYRRTVVDSPETMAPYIGVGTGDLFTIERVRFEWQEDYLVGYRDYEYVPNSEYANGNGDAYEGSPVITFPASHFDIAYDYDPATGEKTNVRRANTTDREWPEREFAYVNWAGTNLGSDMFILPVDIYDTDKKQGGITYVQPNDAASPYRARLNAASGYLDFVVNHYAIPDVMTCYYDFEFGWDSFTACASGEIKVRHAFWQVDEAQEQSYQPLIYPDTAVLTDANGREILDPATGEVRREPIFDRFGYYRLDKLTYDDERGLTESGRLNRIIRFNIWDKSIDANGNLIPESSRHVRPVVYYLNWDFPEELKASANDVAAQWNGVFKQTVAALQGKSSPEIPDVFILRENDCNTANLNAYLGRTGLGKDVASAVGVALSADTLDNWCAATEYLSNGDFVWQQMGDPRFNMMYWVSNIVPSGWSGYGPMLGDPVSGRNVVSTAYIMGWTIEAAATRALEYIDYINGDLTLEDLLSGTDVPNYFFGGDYDPAAMTGDVEQVQARAAQQASPEYLAELEARFQGMGGSYQEMMVPMENSAHFDERLSRIAGTDLEKQFLVRPEDVVLASRGNWRPGEEVTEELWQQASFVSRMREIRRKTERTSRFFQERTMCPMAELDDALIGLANRLKDLDRPARRQKLREEIFKAVMLHEVGHNVGLRHNFEGSYDALNYIPTYTTGTTVQRGFWDLEAQLGADEQAKIAASQPELKYSSIMDYHGKTNGDFHGLGLYDAAAVKFGYGQLIEVFNDTSIQGGKVLRNWRFLNDYKELLAHFGSVDAMYDRGNVKFDWTCSDAGASYCLRDGQGGGELLADGVEALTEREVPYMFCSDEYAGLTPTCKRFDFGANQREVQQANYTKYKNYFIFTNFLRNRLTIDWDRALARGEQAFSDTLLTYQYMYLYRAKDPNFLTTDLGADMAQAVADGLNLMSEVVAMPRPATYYRCALDLGGGVEDVTYYTGGYLDYDPIVDPATALGPNGELCDMMNSHDLGLGQTYPLFIGFSEEYINYTLTYLGTYWDKMNALFWLSYPIATYFRENQQEDLRSFSVSFYRLYNQEVNDVLLGLIEFDQRSLASGFDEATLQVVPKKMVDVGTQADSARIVPALARNMQYYSLLYGMAFLTSPLDDSLDFAKHARVVVKGAADDFLDTLPGTLTVAECKLPEAGVTYRAAQTSAETSRIDVAYNFVNECATRVTDRQAAITALEAAEDALNVASPSDPGYADLLIAADERRDEYTLADDLLRETEQALIFMRSLNRVYEYGAGY